MIIDINQYQFKYIECLEIIDTSISTENRHSLLVIFFSLFLTIIYTSSIIISCNYQNDTYTQYITFNYHVLHNCNPIKKLLFLHSLVISCSKEYIIFRRRIILLIISNAFSIEICQYKDYCRITTCCSPSFSCLKQLYQRLFLSQNDAIVRENCVVFETLLRHLNCCRPVVVPFTREDALSFDILLLPIDTGLRVGAFEGIVFAWDFLFEIDSYSKF